MIFLVFSPKYVYHFISKDMIHNKEIKVVPQFQGQLQATQSLPSYIQDSNHMHVYT